MPVTATTEYLNRDAGRVLEPYIYIYVAQNDDLDQVLECNCSYLSN